MIATWRVFPILILLVAPQLRAAEPAALQPPFKWKSTAALIAPGKWEDPCVAVKDPSVVRHGDKWHVFATIRSETRSHQIEYIRFDDWKNTANAERFVLKMCDGYFCSPQVFYFEPQKKWFMILQVTDPERKPALQPAYSTNDDLANPDGWSKPTLLYEQGTPPGVKAWIDFWVICDEARAHLFFTSNDGRLWRAQTKMTDFPAKWDTPRLVLQADIFEASCTYTLKGGGFLTLIEAQHAGTDGWRFYKAYHADKLDGEWNPLADTWEIPFASATNVSFDGESWTDSISHGELLRDSNDQRLIIDPAHLKFLYQGVGADERRNLPYGKIPWRLGLLERVE